MRQTAIYASAIVLLFFLGVAVVRVASPSSVVVTWETVSEVDSAGFLLYRSDTPDGPFLLLVGTPIPAQGDSLVGTSYQYEDREVVWGRRYYYQLEEVERSGASNRSDQVVDGRAGAGWPWAMTGGALLAGLGAWARMILGRTSSPQAVGDDG